MAHGPAEELTGQRRYRKAYKLLEETPHMVLQVEVSFFDTAIEGRPGKWATKWRDATPADIPRQELHDVGS